MKMMGVEELIQSVQREERVALTEAESKTLLKSYGIPVVEEIVVTDEDSAVSGAQGLGYPVVLKGLGARLTHKTERGLVKVNLQSAEETRQAYRQIKESAGEDWEGCLIQPLISGKREFVAGLFRDAQFGPCVMFGLGGIFTEALADVAFRIAPLNAVQAQGMLDEIKARKLLGNFSRRGGCESGSTASGPHGVIPAGDGASGTLKKSISTPSSFLRTDK